MKKPFTIHLPGGLILEMNLEAGHPANLTLTFRDKSGVKFSYDGSKGGSGDRKPFGNCKAGPEVPGKPVRYEAASMDASASASVKRDLYIDVDPHC